MGRLEERLLTYDAPTKFYGTHMCTKERITKKQIFGQTSNQNYKSQSFIFLNPPSERTDRRNKSKGTLLKKIVKY